MSRGGRGRGWRQSGPRGAPNLEHRDKEPSYTQGNGAGAKEQMQEGGSKGPGTAPNWEGGTAADGLVKQSVLMKKKKSLLHPLLPSVILSCPFAST